MSDSARQQILSTAVRLFFEQGYTQTGINQIIDESAVARRTFYHHFPSKEELGAAYIDLAAARWLAELRRAGEGRRSAVGVIRGVFEHVERFASQTRFRGCGMLNMASEFADAGSSIRERIREHKTAQRDLLRELLHAFGVPPRLADQVHVLLEGAIAAAAGLLELSPIRSASQTALLLIRTVRAEEDA